jgi:hypothetical protein
MDPERLLDEGGRARLSDSRFASVGSRLAPAALSKARAISRVR